MFESRKIEEFHQHIQLYNWLMMAGPLNSRAKQNQRCHRQFSLFTKGRALIQPEGLPSTGLLAQNMKQGSYEKVSYQRGQRAENLNQDGWYENVLYQRGWQARQTWGQGRDSPGWHESPLKKAPRRPVHATVIQNAPKITPNIRTCGPELETLFLIGVSMIASRIPWNIEVIALHPETVWKKHQQILNSQAYCRGKRQKAGLLELQLLHKICLSDTG